MGYLHPTDFEQPGKGGGKCCLSVQSVQGEILDVIFRGARVNHMKEYKDSGQTGECYPAFGIRRCPDKDQRNGNRMKHKHNRDQPMRYAMNRCHVCGAVISDANRSRLTDRLCDGCMWNVEDAGAICLLLLSDSQYTIATIDRTGLNRMIRECVLN